MKNALKTVTAIAVLLAAWGSAEAGQIFTPVVFTVANGFTCIAVNVGSTPIIVKMQFILINGSVQCELSDLTIQPGRLDGIGCGVDPGDVGYCKFSTPPHNVLGSIPSLRANICSFGGALACADAR